MERILIIDDEIVFCRHVTDLLHPHGYRVSWSLNGKDGIEKYKKLVPDMVLLDIVMAGLTGFEVLSRLKEINPGIPIIILTGYPDFDGAVSAIKGDAFDYIPKCDVDKKLVGSISKALSPTRGEEAEHSAGTNAPLSTLYTGCSEQAKEIRRRIEVAAQSDVSVVIQGESGNGKSLIADLIHRCGPRRAGPFVTVDCHALLQETCAIELFGYERGACRGSSAPFVGKVKEANGGVILFENVETLSEAIQKKLLRFAGDKSYLPIGRNKDLKSTAKIISTTSISLEDAARRGEFIDSLYHRLNQYPIVIPPLCARKEDIQDLAEDFLEKAVARHDTNVSHISPEAMQVMMEYPWPGNVRELMSFIRRAVMDCNSSSIMVNYVFEHLLKLKTSEGDNSPREENTIEIAVKKLKMEMAQRALLECGGNIAKAAERLGVSRPTIYGILNEKNMKKK